MCRCIAPSWWPGRFCCPGPRSHQKRLSRPVPWRAILGTAIGKHCHRCKPDSSETWRGKPGPTGASCPASEVSPHSQLQCGLGPWERRRLGRWECGGHGRPEYAYWTRLFSGHITISLTSSLVCFACSAGETCPTSREYSRLCCSQPLSPSSSRNTRILSTGASS